MKGRTAACHEKKKQKCGSGGKREKQALLGGDSQMKGEIGSKGGKELCGMVGQILKKMKRKCGEKKKNQNNEEKETITTVALRPKKSYYIGI